MRFHARLCTFWQRLARLWGEVRSEQIQDGFAVSFPGAFIHQVVNDVWHFSVGQPEFDCIGGSEADLSALELMAYLKDDGRFAGRRLPY